MEAQCTVLAVQYLQWDTPACGLPTRAEGGAGDSNTKRYPFQHRKAIDIDSSESVKLERETLGKSEYGIDLILIYSWRAMHRTYGRYLLTKKFTLHLLRYSSYKHDSK